ncbi:MAG: class I SAM-dependent methyltransferase [Parasphingorhabdus sp.]|uniref:class I SAM-dependent methyltransferase n=1 Tax=Parasphingorhabdus sp. TaxID=2709688 RepID=UPI0032979FB9
MQIFWKIPLLGRAVYAIWKMDARRKYRLTHKWLKPADHLVEIGSGPGSVVEIFRDQGLEVTALDIADNSIEKRLRPIIYDGEIMPFDDQTFDTGLLLTILHHTKRPDVILHEAARISKRLIIIEDVYESPWQAFYTKWTDKLTNMEFFGHPHSNRSHQQWLATFDQMGLHLRHSAVHKLAYFYRQAVYVLDVDPID